MGWVLLALTLLGTVVAFVYLRGARQSSVWMGPYLSGAANWKMGGEFLVDWDELKVYHDLSPTEQDAYRFHHSEHATYYGANPVGYVYLIVLAKFMFPFAGDQTAIVLLQLTVHTLLCSWVFFSTAFKPVFKTGFLVLYALNPLILGFAAYNHYYFWQAVPSFYVLYLWSERRASLGVVLTAAFAVGLALTARPTAILLCPLAACLAARRFGWVSALAVLFIIGGVMMAINRPMNKNVFHSVYIGVGAYANPDQINLSDDDGYALYQKETGEKLVASLGGNYYDKDVMDRYKQITRQRYFEILREHPVLLTRNAVLNIAQAFLLGYQTRRGDGLNYLVAGLGAAFALGLAWRRAWFYLLVIPLATLTFTPYYPPIRAYMYGAYAFIVFALLCSLKAGGEGVGVKPAPGQKSDCQNPNPLAQ